MFETAEQRASIRPLPILVVLLAYMGLFGLFLFDNGFQPMMIGVSLLLLAGLCLSFGRISVHEVPAVIGILYLAGTLLSYLLISSSFGRPLVLLTLLSLLFLAGIAGNVFYFLSEQQKMNFLNGQISEDGLTLKKIENFFPLWLVIGGNILLILAVTPMFWMLVQQSTGKAVFETATPFKLFDWFGYVLANINKSFLGVGEFFGVKFPTEEAVKLSTIGKGFVSLFRAGTISLALGAVKRYLDLRATTKRLTVALGRSGMELDQKEAELDGKPGERSAITGFDSQRRMWQTRFRQLLRLYPAQLDTLLGTLQGKGLWQLKLQSKLKKKKGVEASKYTWELASWIRAEIAALLAEPRLYTENPSAREKVLRTLLLVLEGKATDKDLPPELRRRAVVTAVQLLRSTDPEALRERVRRAVASMAKRAEEHAPLEGWFLAGEERAALAASIARVLLGEKQQLSALLKPLRRHRTAIQADARFSISSLTREISSTGAAILRAVQRMMQSKEGDEIAPMLDEVKISLQKLEGSGDDAYRSLAADALEIGFLEIFQTPEVQSHAAEVLLACQATYAVPKAWKLWQWKDKDALHDILLESFVEAGMSGDITTFLGGILSSGQEEEQARAAELLGCLPAEEANRAFLRQAIEAKATPDQVRWMALCAIARLGDEADLPFLQKLSFTKTKEARLWAASRYACFGCGEAKGLVELVSILATTTFTEEISEAVQDVLQYTRGSEGTSAILALNPQGEADARREACEDIVAERSPLALLVLGHLLQDAETSKSLRQGAAEDLGLLGRALHRDDIEALGKEKSPAQWVSASLLFAMENDADRLVRIRSARALGRLGLDDISERFKKILSDPEENSLLRQVIAQAVGEMGDPRWLDILLQLYPGEKSAQVRQGMLEALHLLGAEIDFFLSCTQEKNAKVQQIAIESLASRPLSEAQRQGLLTFLQSQHREVRAAAAETLGKLGVEEAILPCCRLVDHEQESDKDVRRAALGALARLARRSSARETVRPVLEKTFKEDPDHLVVQDCAKTMAKVLGSSASPLFVHALEHLKSHEPWQKGFAGIVRSLGDVGTSDASPLLFKLLTKELNAQFVHLPRLIGLIRPAGRVGGVQSIPFMMDLVRRNDPAFSWIAAQVLAEVASPEAVEPLEAFLAEKRADESLEPNLEAAILIALVRLGSLERLSELLAMLLDPERPVARRRALGMLADLDIGLSELTLLLAMNPQHCPDEKIREAAVGSMGRLMNKVDAGIQALRWQATFDPRAKIREAAQKAVQDTIRELHSSLQEIQESNEVIRLPGSVIYRGEAIHPAFTIGAANDDQIRERRERRQQTAGNLVLVPASSAPSQGPASQTATTEPGSSKGQAPAQTTSATAAPTPSKPKRPPEPIYEERPTFLKRLTAALLEDDRKTALQLLASKEEAFLQAAHWTLLQTLLSDLQAFEKRFPAQTWSIVPGTFGGPRNQRPFLLRSQPVTRAEYRAFCIETSHPMPRGWKASAATFENPNDPVTGLTWWDASRFCETRGYAIPELSEFQRAQDSGLSLSSPASSWKQAGLSEWTATLDPRRHDLVHLLPGPSSSQLHTLRTEGPKDTTFRYLYRLDSKRGLIEEVIARNSHRSLRLLWLFAVQHLHAKLTKDEEEIQKSLSFGQMTDPIKASIVKVLLGYKDGDPAEDTGKTTTSASTSKPTKPDKEPAPAKPAPPPPPPPPPKPKEPTPLERFWKAIDAGQWKEALALLKQHGSDFPTTLRQNQAFFEEIFAWQQRNLQEIWCRGPWQGPVKDRPFFLRRKPITRAEYFNFCKEKGHPLPLGWGLFTKEISEPNEPVRGISLQDARAYAAHIRASLPSFEQILRASSSSWLAAHGPEWTTTLRPRSFRLIQGFDPSEATKEYRRSPQLDEASKELTIRLLLPVAASEIPTWLRALEDKLPKVIALPELPAILASSLRTLLLQAPPTSKPA